MIEMKWNRDKVEVWEDEVLKYDLKGREVYSHRSKKTVLLSTFKGFLSNSGRRGQYAETDKLADSIIYTLSER